MQLLHRDLERGSKMEKQKGKKLLADNKQPLKAITKQDLHDLKEYLERLVSWKEPLALVNEFFENQAIPLNKEKIVREYHSQAIMFQSFYEIFVLSMDTIEQKIEILEKREKVRV